MKEVPEIEHALIDDGIILIKLWYSITKENQQKRFKERMTNPLKHWKLSPVDQKAQEMDAHPVIREMAVRYAETLKTHVDLYSEMNVLDFGCGSGLIAQINGRTAARRTKSGLSPPPTSLHVCTPVVDPPA